MQPKELNRANPGLIMFLVDQSYSMLDSFGANPTIRKCDGVSDAINKLIAIIIKRAMDHEIGVKDLCDVGVIGYGAKYGNDYVGNALPQAFSGEDVSALSKIAANPLRKETRIQKVPDGVGGISELPVQFPIWLEAKGESGTPMALAFDRCVRIVREWIKLNGDSLPPIVFNITDGEYNEGGSPAHYISELKSLSTSHGNALLYNLHLSDKQISPIAFPTSSDVLPDAYAKELFEYSSDMPDYMVAFAKEKYKIGPTGAPKCFVFNGDLISVIEALEIGTRRVS